MAKPTTANRFDAARGELEAANRQLAELEAARNRALLADDDKVAAKLAGQIDDLHRLIRGHRDKIDLLEAEAERETNERRAKERAGLIERVEHKLGERAQAVAELQAAIAKADQLLQTIVEQSRAIDAAWPFAPHDRLACILPSEHIVSAIRNEIFRISRPQLFGREGAVAPINLPGGKSPRLEWAGTPDRVPEISARFREASACASTIMRTGKSTSGATIAPAEAGVPVFALRDPPPLGPAEQKLSQLLRQQAQLANDVTPAGEAAYSACVREIAEIEAARNGATQ
jgi:hypothetical protein